MALIRGNALSLSLADESVDLIVTSPPYFALRSYTDSCGSCGGRVGQAGTGDKRTEAASTGLQGGKQPSFKENANRVDPDPDCPDCNGTGRGHYDGQIGSEATPAEFIAALLEVTRECVRALKPSGSLWVNLGDKYAAGHGGSSTEGKGITVRKRSSFEAKPKERPDLPDPPASWGTREATGRNVVPGFRPKSLMGMPWRYALACIDDLGLILRAEVIWSKPNGLPESVQDRVRRSHENWFHFTKEPRYFSAVDEIREPHTATATGRDTEGWRQGPSGMNRGTEVGRTHDDGAPLRDFALSALGKLPGSVWTIPTEPLRVPDHLPQHFAAFPSEWPKRIILGWSPSGICVECGEGRRPVVEKALVAVQATNGHGRTEDNPDNNRDVTKTPRASTSAAITGESCACPTPDAPTRPAIILDPFCGTGTTVAVANALGRHGIGVDLSADYLKLARWRCADPKLRAKVLGVDPPAPQVTGQLDLLEHV